MKTRDSDRIVSRLSASIVPLLAGPLAGTIGFVDLGCGKLTTSSSSPSASPSPSPSPSPSVKISTTPAAILGQRSANVSNAGAGPARMNFAAGVTGDNTHILVADANNNRVLIWNSIPSSIGQPADIVIGQPDFDSTGSNQGLTAPTASNLSSPTSVSLLKGKLFVTDSSNARVLVWNSIPTTNNQAADLVVGQPDFISGTGDSTLNQMYTGNYGNAAVDSQGGLYITDTSNNRVLYYSSIPTTNGASATFYFGSGNSGTSQNEFSGPRGLSVSGNTLAVADLYNNRVLFFNIPPTGNSPNAIRVLGQSNYSDSDSNCTSTGMSYPNHALFAKNGNSLYVVDNYNNRILYWSNLSQVSNGDAASQVFGQPNMTTCASNAGSVSQTTFNLPNYLYLDSSNYMWINDYANSRITVNPGF